MTRLSQQHSSRGRWPLSLSSSNQSWLTGEKQTSPLLRTSVRCCLKQIRLLLKRPSMMSCTAPFQATPRGSCGLEKSWRDPKGAVSTTSNQDSLALHSRAATLLLQHFQVPPSQHEARSLLASRPAAGRGSEQQHTGRESSSIHQPEATTGESTFSKLLR